MKGHFSVLNRYISRYFNYLIGYCEQRVQTIIIIISLLLYTYPDNYSFQYSSCHGFLHAIYCGYLNVFLYKHKYKYSIIVSTFIRAIIASQAYIYMLYICIAIQKNFGEILRYVISGQDSDCGGGNYNNNLLLHVFLVFIVCQSDGGFFYFFGTAVVR